MGNVDRQTLDSTWNGEIWKRVRSSFLAGERADACSHCWKRESQGLVSPRLHHQEPVDTGAIQNDGSMTHGPQIVSLRLGRTCNLKCIMCAPFNSTKWQEDSDLYNLHVDQGQRYVEPPTRTTELLHHDSFLGNVQHVSFVGGEPLLIPAHRQILQGFIESGRAPNITLKYFTNGTILPLWLEELWKNFKKIELRISIDGTKDVFEYIRYPAKWNQVAENILAFNRIKADRLEMGLNFLLMNVNAFDLKNLFEWRNRQQWTADAPVIRIDSIVYPDFFDLTTLTVSQSMRLLAELKCLQETSTIHPFESSQLGDLILQIKRLQQAPPQLKHQRLQKYLSDLDRRRDLRSAQVFPHIWQNEDDQNHQKRPDKVDL